MSSSNLTINTTEHYWFYEAPDCLTQLNPYLTACPNYDEIVAGNSTGFYWDSLERNASGGIFTAFGSNEPFSQNTNLHFVANWIGGKNTTKKVRAFVAF